MDCCRQQALCRSAGGATGDRPFADDARAARRWIRRGCPQLAGNGTAIADSALAIVAVLAADISCSGREQRLFGRNLRGTGPAGMQIAFRLLVTSNTFAAKYAKSRDQPHVDQQSDVSA